MIGRSFVSMLEGGSVPIDDRFVGVELMGKRAIRKGNWKLVHMPDPYGTDEWQLFDLANDLGESRDVAEEHPDIAADLEAAWKTYADTNGVIIPDWVSGY